ncbi:hypothetical protein [Foetidibacter luteolus]|uniref:hypothetical protein n=1 Tax=Foetidibacter luteolus TaxID=2608880 RepID=UPI00129AEAE1|nr:hypothetical protein [Foetidibacter luteolus]
MKIYFTKPNFSKATKLLAVSAIAVLMASCSKNQEAVTPETVSIDDAADAVSQAVSPESDGLVLLAESSARTAAVSSACGIQKDTAIAGQNVAGAAVTYSYAYQQSISVNCSAGIPGGLLVISNGKTSYDAPRMSSNDSSHAQVDVSWKAQNGGNYLLNATYQRTGTQISKVRNKKSFGSTIIITSTDILVDKKTYQVISGTAAINISGAGSGGGSFSYSGQVIFQGNKKATVELGNGSSYVINW